MEFLISDRALDNMEREARKQARLETGGILAGLRRGENTIITHATGPGPRATHSPHHFIKDTPYLQSVLNLLFEYFGANYLGVWHKHTPELPRPSSGDLSSARDEIADGRTGVDCLILPIITLKDGHVDIFPFVVDKDGPRKIEWQSVAHTDLLTPDLIGRQWYDSPSGRQRASQELSLLRGKGVAAEVRQTGDRGYNFYVALDKEATQYLVCACPHDYPVSPPEVTMYHPKSHEYRPVALARLMEWTIDCHIVDLYREVVGG